MFTRVPCIELKMYSAFFLFANNWNNWKFYFVLFLIRPVSQHIDSSPKHNKDVSHCRIPGLCVCACVLQRKHCCSA